MNATVKLTGVTPGQLRKLLAQCNTKRRNAVGASVYLNGPAWAPQVTCEGPDLFTVYLPTFPARVAAEIVDAIPDMLG